MHWLAVLACAFFAATTLWESFGPARSGHFSTSAAYAMAGENMVHWEKFAIYGGYLLKPATPDQYYCHHPYGIVVMQAIAYLLFGHHWFTARAGAMFSSIIAAPSLYGFGRKAWGIIPASVATIYFVFCPIDISYATFSNLEEPTIGFALLLAWATAKAWETSQTRYVVISAIGALGTANGDWAGLVLLMPHGYEGAGPEHSSARIERWLQMAAEDNIQVCNPTTPAQFFHLLRRQVNRPWRKPLAVMTPKSLLRNPVATSTLDELVNGEFQRVIGDDSGTPPADVKRIILTSGKVFYDLHKARAERKRSDVAIIRLEQYYPFGPSLRAILGQYPAGTDLVWVQEEPKNMGAWYFIKAHLPDHIANRFPLRVVSRAESASPATGSHASHDLEQDMLVDDAFA